VLHDLPSEVGGLGAGEIAHLLNELSLNPGAAENERSNRNGENDQRWKREQSIEGKGSADARGVVVHPTLSGLREESSGTA
jgi:hypothetical protein